jgi:hypothetical protein
MKLLALHNPRRLPGFALLALFCLLGIAGARANEAETIRLTAKPPTILADGSSTTIITAEPRDGSGRLVSDDQFVSFSTTLGTIEPAKQVQGGQASARLTSSTIAGLATITASSGHATAQVQVTFTNEPVTASDNVRAVTVRARYLLYNDYEQILDCVENVDVHIGDLHIRADRAQFNFLRGRIIAQGAPGGSTLTITQGDRSYAVDRLYYNWESRTGYVSGLKEPARGLFAFESRGMTLTPAPSAPIDTFTLQELTPSPLAIKSDRVVYLPGQEMQFTHAQIMLNGKSRITLPYHVMPVGPSKLGQAQYIGLGYRGPLLDIPYYVAAGTLGSSQLRLKYNAPEGLYGATVPGWALDLIGKYNFGRDTEGNVQLTRVTSPDWGLTWVHNQNFGADTRGYFNVDTRSGLGLGQRYSLGNFTVTKQAPKYSLNLTGFAAKVQDNPAGNVSVGLQSAARPLGGGFSWNMGVQASKLWSSVTSTDPVSGEATTQRQTIDSQGVNARLAAPAMHVLGARLTASVGQGITLSDGHARHSQLGTIGLIRPIGRQGSFNLTYNYNDFGQAASNRDIIGIERQTLTTSLTYARYPRWSASAYATMGLDRHSQNVRLNTTYNFDRLWSMNVNAGYFSQVLSIRDLTDPELFNRTDFGVTDVEVRINRIIGERALALVYESYRNRIYLDYTPGRYF